MTSFDSVDFWNVTCLLFTQLVLQWLYFIGVSSELYQVFGFFCHTGLRGFIELVLQTVDLLFPLVQRALITLLRMGEFFLAASLRLNELVFEEVNSPIPLFYRTKRTCKLCVQSFILGINFNSSGRSHLGVKTAKLVARTIYCSLYCLHVIE